MVDIRLFPKQIEFLQAKERSVLLQSGIGAGKSFVGALWVVLMALKYKNVKALIVARDFPQLKMATLSEVEKVLKLLEMQEGVHYIWNKSNNDIKFFNGTQIYCRGANNFDSSFRGINASFIYADEADYYKEEAWSTLKGRLRIAPELMRVTSSPKGYNHIWEDFFKNKNETRKVIVATTYDNPTLSTEYVEDLRSSYSPRLFEQEVLGKRLQLNVGCVYNEFSREKHVAPCRDKLTDKDQLFFFTDYNIANYCGVYMFERDGMVYAIGEEHLKYEGTRKMAEQIKAKYANDRHVIVCGDSAGNNKRDVAATKTNYEIFKEVLGFGSTQKVRNPPVYQRIIAANSNLYHKKLVIDPSCKTLIKDLELLAWKEDGKEVEKTIDLSHASDAYTYGVWYWLPIRPKRRATSNIQL